MADKITVVLTRAEWDALRATVAGELESLTERDEKSGGFDDLRRAAEALDAARRAAS